ncbi:polysaccharide biosynthesis protein [Prevotella histicola]|jgi:rmlD substrate binding domain protein|uniref:polysaccharide biosynthesis protein n=1 Tax=Prevotella histicola TaxID=470565 RepID=UPI001C5F23E2|nr:nucleoside-diphosphate sugar epimerase/dehydratase [Prevotella histicola]MBF1403540.1 polysaccharide biosynthesis protein [Prevotella histicola]MBF1409424.1 polysaccharide biosynthesis protein [Prevotella histicola]MBS6662155.1 polysaccharide biosynthesis protein [Prevotella histicola]MBW4711896.1 polysaccharide biosynthesis protein [Prevotella histicola]MBW4774683.1 polysaccharide biosynthesis protein [Prevotella histicola]
MKIIQKLLNWYLSINALPYWVILVVDSFICYLSGIFVFWMYYHGAIAWENMVLLTKTIFMYMVFNLIGFRLFRTYSGIIRYSSFVDLQRVALAMVLSLSIAEVMHYVIYHWNLEFVRLEGRQIAAMYLVATIGMMLFRILVKSLYEVVFNTDKGLRTLIYGVKDGGVGLAKTIRSEQKSNFQLKGFIAHDPTLGGRILMGEKVYMADEDLAKYIKVLKIQAVLVSPLQNDKFRNDLKLQDTLLNLGVRIFMSSGEKEWNQNDDYTKVQLKEISIEDLLPRDQIHVDMDSIGNLLRGKKIMITGSAGSIGSEMVRQIAVYNPTELILIDQAETPQHNIRLMMHFEWPNIKAHTIVANISNEERMDKIFHTYRPDYVFHAAAYKHVPMMENNPSESIQNNILGTKVIADLSVKYGVKKFVMISTDKAVNPTNVMGCSKRICEIYCQSLNKMINEHAGDKPVTQFVTTRFGNVLGSNGSVIPLFEKQIKNGGPVTVTDPNIIRFFMLIPEACKLVLEAGTHGSGGEIFVFDMGKPVKIADLAKRMIKLSGAKDIEIKYTGLRAGEKLYEEVLSTTENTLPSFHEKIRIAKVREYDYSEVSKQIDSLIALSHTYDDMAIVEKMKEIVPEYVSNNSKYSVLDKK